jgi:hypothetical protein
MTGAGSESEVKIRIGSGEKGSDPIGFGCATLGDRTQT